MRNITITIMMIKKYLPLIGLLVLPFLLPSQAFAISMDTSQYSITNGPFFNINNNPLIDSFNLDIAFNIDGTKIFILGDSGDEVNQLTLNTPFDVSSISTAGIKTFSLASIDIKSRSIVFNTDGTKMFILGDRNDSVYEFTLDTPFDVSTVSTTGRATFSVGGFDNAPRGIAFNTDGTKMFILGEQHNSVYEFSLSTPFDLTTVLDGTPQTFIITFDTKPFDVAFNIDGTSMFILGDNFDNIYEVKLNTGFDLSSIPVQNPNIFNPNVSGRFQGFAFNPDRDKMFTIGLDSSDRIRSYDFVNMAGLTTTISGPSLTNSDNIPITVTFSESVAGFTIDDIEVSGGTKGDFSGTGAAYSFTIAPAGDGTITVDIRQNRADGEDYGNQAATQFTTTSDRTRPTVAITSTEPTPTNSDSIPISVRFSEAVTGFIQSDITITGGTPSGFSGSGASYSFTIAPSGDGPITVDIPENGSTDSAGNANQAAAQFTITSNRTKPTVAITSTEPTLTNSDSIPISVRFSEPVTGFAIGDIVVSGGTKGTFSGSNGSYSFTITPTGDGLITVDIPEDVAAAIFPPNNENQAAPQFTITSDRTEPTVAITSSEISPTNVDTIPITVVFSESVDSFVMSDITVSGGTIGAFSGSGTTYTFTIAPSVDGPITVDIRANIYTDDAGNGSQAAPQFTITSDRTRPTVAITSVASPTSSDNIPITVTFSETVIGFTIDDIVVSGGTKSILSGSGALYSFTIAPAADGPITVDIQENIAVDTAGNDNQAAAQFTIESDRTRPTVVITSVASPTNLDSIPITVTFSESVTNFIQSDITISGGTPSGFSGSGRIYTFNVAPTGDGLIIDIPENVAASSSPPNNENEAAVQFIIVTDRTPPTVTLQLAGTTPTGATVGPGRLRYRVIFNELEIVGFTKDDITVSGPTEAPPIEGFVEDFGSASATQYEFEINAVESSELRVSIPANIATDLAGNANTASNEFQLTIDATAPSPPVITTVDTTTNNDTITITGTTDADTTAVDILRGTTSIGAATVSGTTFTFVVPLVAGNNAISATATDSNSNISSRSNQVRIIYNLPPTISDLENRHITLYPGEPHRFSFAALFADPTSDDFTIEFFMGGVLVSSEFHTIDFVNKEIIVTIPLGYTADRLDVSVVLTDTNGAASTSVTFMISTPIVDIPTSTPRPEVEFINGVRNAGNNLIDTETFPFLEGGNQLSGVIREIFVTHRTSFNAYDFIIQQFDRAEDAALASSGNSITIQQASSLNGIYPIIFAGGAIDMGSFSNPFSITNNRPGGTPRRVDCPCDITFTYDESVLGMPEAEISIFHFDGTTWQYLASTVDTNRNTVKATTNSFSPFTLGKVAAAPIVDTGFDQAVVVGNTATVVVGNTATVTISSSVTAAPTGSLTYHWTQVDGPPVGLAGTDSATVTVIVPNNLDIGTILTFNLRVTNAGVITDAIATITIIAPTTGIAPTTVVAGGTATVTISGSVTADLTGSQTYLWTQVGGPTAELENSDSITVTVTVPANLDIGTTLTFNLRIINAGVITNATATITVVAPTTTVTSDVLNAEILPRLVQTMVASTVSAIESRIDAVLSGQPEVARYKLEGQNIRLDDRTRLSTSLQDTLIKKLPAYLQQLKDGAMDWKQMLGNSSFVLPNIVLPNTVLPNIVLPPNMASSEDRVVTVWGKGDYTNLSGKSFDGGVVSAQLGVDTLVDDNLLVGALLSLSKGDVDYVAKDANGEYKHSITSIHPYAAWSDEGINLWASAGYGQGKLEIENSKIKDNSNTKLLSLSGGVKGQLTEGIRLKSDLNLIQINIATSKNQTIASQKIASQRLRLLLEMSQERQLETGVLKPTLEIGARYDGGDGDTGTSAILNTGLNYANAATGWTIAGKTRALIGRKNYKEWGVSGVVNKHAAPDGQGTEFILSPSYGQSQDNGGSSAKQVWQQKPSDYDSNRNPSDYSMRVNTRLGYGFLAPRENGLLTPYGEATFSEFNRYLFGINWQRHSRFSMSLSREHAGNSNAKNYKLSTNWKRPQYIMTLLAGRKEVNNGTAKHRIILRSRIGL